MTNYLIKFGVTELPNRLIMADGYSVTPNMRTELEAFRDVDISLHRVTSPNFKTKITLTLTPMSQTDRTLVQSIINGATLIATERKVLVTYWNEEEGQYKSGDFYITDTTFQTLGSFGGERWYKSTTYELIEY